ncbi:sulfatase-like hydrolase/transferase [Paraburkholderia dipogonis]|uniref:Sulfatase-like hydrolase/transferase n=1 Tax=Paraburkholderia dipogonis TaxID=1211383 RepID=A0ABW9B4J5_9BURK
MTAGQPAFLAVNLVNPHDAMFVNTDPPGSDLQDSNKPMLGNARPPEDALYQQTWDRTPLAASRHQPYDEPGRPPAHGMFNAAHANLVGAYPFTDERIRTYQNNYFNCIRDCDTHVVRLLQTLQTLGLDERTIVVMTADHGDHVGAHQLVGRGATAYQPQNHVPLVIRHPAYPGGKQCNALTSHIDIAPTLSGLRNLATDRTRNGELLLAMNSKLNDMIANEVGEDSPDVMPIRDGKVQVQIRRHG